MRNLRGQGILGLLGQLRPLGLLGLLRPLGQLGLLRPLGLLGLLRPLGLLGLLRPLGLLGLLRPLGGENLIRLSGLSGFSGLSSPSGPSGPIRLSGPISPISPSSPIGPSRPTGLTRPSRPIGFTSYVILLALLILSGCSGDPGDDVAPIPQPGGETGTPIAFSGVMQEEQTVTRAASSLNSHSATRAASSLNSHSATRAASSLNSHSATFTVYGYKNMGYDEQTGSYTDLQQVFPGYTVNWISNSAASSVTNTHNWEYVAQEDEQSVKYWDWDAKAYRFFGVAAGGTSADALDIYEVNKPYETHTATTATVTVPVDCTNAQTVEATPFYSTLWFSNGAGTTRLFGDPVQLEFIKPVAKVRYKFIFEDPTIPETSSDPGAPSAETLLANTSFKPTNGATIAIKGDLIITYPLTGTATTASVTIDRMSVSGTDFNALTERNTWYTVLPADGQGTYTLSVEVGGQPQSCIVPAEYMNWAPGYEYTYIFKVHVDGGVGINTVQSAFTPWTLEPEKSHEVYNW